MTQEEFDKLPDEEKKRVAGELLADATRKAVLSALGLKDGFEVLKSAKGFAKGGIG
jgi:hypothetical protein